jgi:hypothetical protein
MKLTRVIIPAAAFVLTVGLAGTARSQSATESDTTVTTAPAAPTVTSKTVTRKEVVNPPVIVNPPPASTETTTTETNTADSSAPVVQEKDRSKTTYGPLGVTHSDSTEKSSSY